MFKSIFKFLASRSNLIWKFEKCYTSLFLNEKYYKKEYVCFVVAFISAFVFKIPCIYVDTIVNMYVSRSFMNISFIISSLFMTMSEN